MYRLINELYKKKVRQFIVTSSSNKQVNLLIENLFGNFKPFEFIISSDDVIFHKHHPIHLKAVKLSGISRKNSIVFEDSNPGIRSSLAAKLPTIFVPSNIPTNIDKNLRVDFIINSLEGGNFLSNVIKDLVLDNDLIDYNFLNSYLKSICNAKN